MASTGQNALPVHVGVIMDGNGRWAAARGLPRNMGHKRGAEIVGDIVRHAAHIGIEYLTVYALSTENWKRPPEEVKGILRLLREYLKDANRYRKENTRITILGDRSRLDDDLQEMIDKVERDSAGNTGVRVNFAINYGGRDEIVNAARAVARMVMESGDAERIDEALVESCLYTSGQPDCDLIIRTGGEKRVSNFLLWQGAYAELVFTDVLWPDFGPADFDNAIAEYKSRARRMGGI